MLATSSSVSIKVDTQPAFSVEAAWTFESLPKELCISGLSGLVQEQGSYFVGLPARALKKCPNFFNASSPEQSLSQKCNQPWAALTGFLPFSRRPGGPSRKQLVTALLTRSSVPSNVYLDRSLKLRFAVPSPGSYRLHAQEIRAFVRNCLQIGAHFRDCHIRCLIVGYFMVGIEKIKNEWVVSIPGVLLNGYFMVGIVSYGITALRSLPEDVPPGLAAATWLHGCWSQLSPQMLVLTRKKDLVGGDWNWNHGILWLSHSIAIYGWECHHPNSRTPSFFRGVGQPPTREKQSMNSKCLVSC